MQTYNTLVVKYISEVLLIGKKVNSMIKLVVIYL